MFQSTFGEQPVRVHWYVVYDSHNGKVVHTHQFIDIDEDTRTSETEAGNDRARMALQLAEQHADAMHLRVIHAPANFELKPGMTYRVDVTRGELVTLTHPQDSRREFIERVRAEQERKAREGSPQRQEPPTEPPSTVQDRGIEASRSSRGKTKRHKS